MEFNEKTKQNGDRLIERESRLQLWWWWQGRGVCGGIEQNRKKERDGVNGDGKKLNEIIKKNVGG